LVPREAFIFGELPKLKNKLNQSRLWISHRSDWAKWSTYWPEEEDSKFC